jgi:hypothetical protein
MAVILKCMNSEGVYDVNEKWRDQKGAVIFIAIIDNRIGSARSALIKIHTDGKTMEALWASRTDLLPSEMDPDAPYCTYFVWHRE